MRCLTWLEIPIAVFKHWLNCVLHNVETCESAAVSSASIPCRWANPWTFTDKKRKETNRKKSSQTRVKPSVQLYRHLRQKCGSFWSLRWWFQYHGQLIFHWHIDTSVTAIEKSWNAVVTPTVLLLIYQHMTQKTCKHYFLCLLSALFVCQKKHPSISSCCWPDLASLKHLAMRH